MVAVGHQTHAEDLFVESLDALESGVFAVGRFDLDDPVGCYEGLW